MNFALESAMDMLADELGIDPLEFRIKNSLLPGQSVSTGAVPEEWTFREVCELIKPHYERAKKEAAAFKDGPIRRGVGLGPIRSVWLRPVTRPRWPWNWIRMAASPFSRRRPTPAKETIPC